MTERVSCPYCNTSIHLTGNETGRIACPRCGESFAVKGTTESATVIRRSSVAGIPASANGTYLPTPTAANDAPVALRPLVWIIALISLVMLVGSIVYFSKGRPTTTSSTPTTTPRSPAATFPPAATPGLGLLPAESELVAAIQPAALAAYAERTGTDPRKLLTDLGVPTAFFAFLDATKLSLADVESLALGLMLPNDNAIPTVVLILRLREPLQDAATFRSTLKAQSFVAEDGTPREKVEVKGFPMEMLERDPRTYVFATTGAVLAGIENREVIGSSHLAGEVRTAIAGLSPASLVWAVTDSVDWPEKPSVKLADKAAPDLRLTERLADVQSGAMSLSLEPELQFMFRLDTVDTTAAERIRDQITKRIEATPDATVELAKERVTLQLPIEAKQGLPAVRELLP